MRQKDVFWVAGAGNHNYPIRLHKIEEAARLADQLKGIVLVTMLEGEIQKPGTLVYCEGEGRYLNNIHQHI